MSKTRQLTGSNNRIAERDYYEIRGSVFKLPRSIDGHHSHLIVCPLCADLSSNGSRHPNCSDCLQRRRNRRRSGAMDLALLCTSLVSATLLFAFAVLLHTQWNAQALAFALGFLLQVGCAIGFVVRVWRRWFQ